MDPGLKFFTIKNVAQSDTESTDKYDIYLVVNIDPESADYENFINWENDMNGQKCCWDTPSEDINLDDWTYV